MQDPRAAYSAADVVIGMGSSALRGMAFEKPTIVVGAQGFCDTFDPLRATHFERDGLYGQGLGTNDNSALEQQLLALIQVPTTWPALGQSSRAWFGHGHQRPSRAMHQHRARATSVTRCRSVGRSEDFSRLFASPPLPVALQRATRNGVHRRRPPARRQALCNLTP
jgi:hypothetical protein